MFCRPRTIKTLIGVQSFEGSGSCWDCYIQKPQHANDSVMEDNLVYHYRGKEMVGVTVIGVKKYGV
jgi:hypothetical protein